MKQPIKTSKPTPAKQQEQPVARIPEPTKPEPTQPTLSFLVGLTEFTDAPKGEHAARELVIKGAEKQKEHIAYFTEHGTLPKMEGGKKTVAAWFKEVSKGWKVSIRYGQQAIPLTASGETAVVVGKDLSQVTAFLDNVIIAVGKGELDDQIRTISEEKSKALTAAHEKKRAAKKTHLTEVPKEEAA